MLLPNFFIPQCDNLLLLVNPRALFLLQQGGQVHSTIPILRNCNNINSPKFQKMLLAMGHKLYDAHHPLDMNQHFVQLDCQVEYVFRLVGCGKCDICRESRRLDLQNRVRLEAEATLVPPIFFTLTYQPADLPKDGCLCYRDVQLFFKRFRKLLHSQGMPTDFRYLVAGEYGYHFGRPHYHIILFNNPYRSTFTDLEGLRTLCFDLWLCWHKDQWNVFSSPKNFGFCRDGAGAYVSKYVSKDSRWKKRVKPFIHMSTGYGGLGVPYLRKFRDYYQTNALSVFSYVSRLDGRQHDINFGSFMKNFFHPSPSRMVSPKIKFLYKDLSERFQRYVSYGMDYVDAYNLLEQLRPNKNVVAHRLSNDVVPVVISSVMFKWLLSRERVQLDAFIDALGDNCEVDDADLQRYYKYISVPVTQVDNRFNLAQRSAKIRERRALMVSKSKF